MGKKKQEPDDKCVCEKAAVDKDKQIEELKDQLLRLAAEFDNYKKQRLKDMQVFGKIRERAKGIPSKEIEADVQEAVRTARKRA